jgi:hypothetical protein
VNSVEKHKALISQYESVLTSLNPGQANDNAVKELNSKVNGLESQIAEMLSLLKSGNPKPTV